MELVNKKIIKYDPSFEFFFVENEKEKYPNPISNYYLKVCDLSLNITISLKWADWGYNFLKMTSVELKNLDDDFKIKNLINDSIQKKELLEIYEENHIIKIDEKILNSENEFIQSMNCEYNSDLFNENSKINMKLKINLREFIILNNFLFPTFAKFENQT